MNTKLGRHALHALMVTGTLLLLGCSTSLGNGLADARDYAAQVGGDGQDAEETPKAKRPARRMRTSLSMPYFSFAQLNSRS